MPANTPVQVRFPGEELDALDRYRREQRNPPSRAQAIRELIHTGLMRGEVTESDDRSRRGEGRAI
jgi:metal-responsive CopG/Arc/MetJ family transcriptional regulator